MAKQPGKTRGQKAAGFWNGLPKSAKAVFVIGGAAGVAYGIYWLNKQAEIRALKERLNNREQTDCNGVNLTAAAYNIYDACWNYGGGFMEDEETMVNELLKVPPSCVQSLAMIYAKDFSKNLYEDFRTYVEGDLYERVRPLLEQ